MMRIVNRLVLGTVGLAATATAATVLLVAAGVRPPARWPSWLPHHPADPLLAPAAKAGLSAPHTWTDPRALAVATVGVLALLLLIAQAAPRQPRRLRLEAGSLRTAALAEAVRTRARTVPGVAGAHVLIRRGRTPLVELTVHLSEKAPTAATVEPLLAILHEASDSTRLPLRARLRLAPARIPRQRQRPSRRG